ncbi:MAG TPA: ester cyclase [Actinomycetes bacterium]|nr:ester cyclase [Actinomycetes bacterium]
MTNPNRQVALSFYDHLNHRNLDAIESMTSDTYVGHGFGDEGRASLRRDLEGMLAAFSDLRVDVEQSIADGDRVAVRMTMTGTHTGDFAGVPASGNQIDVPSCDVLRIQDGKVAEYWPLCDTARLFSQLNQVQVR